jgi:hypothetical protein
MNRHLAMTCEACRAKGPHVLSCIHTFAPPRRHSVNGDYDRVEDYRAEQEIGCGFRSERQDG